MFNIRLIASLAVSVLLPAVLYGQTIDDKMLQTVRLRAESPRFDRTEAIPFIQNPHFQNGKLSTEFWKEAHIWKLEYEIEAGRNQKAPFETFFLMASDHENFYAAFICLDSEPERLQAVRTDRDRWSKSDNDAVGIYFDTFGDKRSAYAVMANALGVQYDAKRLDRGGQGIHDDLSFDFLWHTESFIYDAGYIVFFRFPFRYLRQSKGDDNKVLWNIMPFRRAPRDFNYKMTAFPWNYDLNSFLGQFPSVYLQKPDIAFSPIQILPYISAVQDQPQNIFDFSPQAGVDIKFQTPEWAVDATLNPDFSQVETDAFVMTTNIRFLPRLAEKRPFFMERADLFRFPISQIIYTRTLLEPEGGLRWTGKKDAHNWAFLSLKDRSTWLLFPGLESSRAEVLENTPSWNSIFRYRYDMSENAVMGIFATSREYEGGYNRLISADGQFAVSGRHTLVGHFIGSFTRIPENMSRQYGKNDESMTGYGYLLRFNRSGRTWSYNVETREYSENLITGMGFLQRTGIRLANAHTSLVFWPESRLVSTIRFTGAFSGTWSSNTSDMMNSAASFGFGLTGIRQTSLFINIKYEKERYSGFVYDLYGGGIHLSTQIFSWYRFGISAGTGKAVDYRLFERMNETSLGWSHSVLLLKRSLQLEQNSRFMKLSQSTAVQSAWIHSLSAEYQITERLAFRNIFQWRDFRWPDPRYQGLVPQMSERLENQVLLRYRINYASAVYLGGFFAQHRTDDHEYRNWQAYFKVSFLI